MQLEKKWLFAVAVLIGLGASASRAAAQEPEFLTTSTLFAVVEANGALARGNGAISSTNLATGQYQVRFARKVQKCVYEASQGFSGNAGVPPGGQITVVRRAGDTRGVFLTTENSAGSPTNRGFHLIVHCP